jgi:hypothetical protein
MNAIRLTDLQTITVGLGVIRPKTLPNQSAHGRLLFKIVSIALIAAGIFALLQSIAGRFLSHDLNYVGMDSFEICGLARGRIARFMFHDRVSFGGAIIAIGLLYFWLAGTPLQARQAWAWWTFLLTGLSGFASFLAYLGYGYLDSWHGLATLTLLPLYCVALVMTRNSLVGSSKPDNPISPPVEAWWHTRIGLGRALLLTTAVGLVFGGITILVIGMTTVFVPQDLRYIGLGASDLLAINRRLVPLIAHDRAGFGGAIATCGLLLFCCLWFAKPSPGLWQFVSIAGGTGFLTAIGVHPIIGYTEFSHLAPAYLGALIFVGGIALCRKPRRFQQESALSK